MGVAIRTLSSVEYYNEMAPQYHLVSHRRRQYIDGINSVVANAIERTSRLGLWIDIGCGDGDRLSKLEWLAKRRVFAVVDNSPEMLKRASQNLPHARAICADITTDGVHALPDNLGISTLLWNVFGHLGSYEQRLSLLKLLFKKTAPGGIVVLDVNNRYNMTQYGVFSVIRNVVNDNFSWRHGCEFPAVFHSDTRGVLSTNVYLASPPDINSILRLAGFTDCACTYVDYKTGRKVTQWRGQMLWIARKNGLQRNEALDEFIL